MGVDTKRPPGELVFLSSPLLTGYHFFQCFYTVSQKSEPPKHFATATANLHRFKWNFTHTRRHLFLSSTSLIPFMRCSILQTAVTNLSYRYYFFTTTAARSVTWTIWKNDWLKSGVVLIRTLLTQQWISGEIDCVRAKGGHFEHLIWTFWLFWLTSTTMETHDLWVMLFKNSYHTLTR